MACACSRSRPNTRRNKDQANPKCHLEWWKERLGDTRLVDLTPELITTTRNDLLGACSFVRDKKGDPKTAAPQQLRATGEDA